MEYSDFGFLTPQQAANCSSQGGSVNLITGQCVDERGNVLQTNTPLVAAEFCEDTVKAGAIMAGVTGLLAGVAIGALLFKK